MQRGFPILSTVKLQRAIRPGAPGTILPAPLDPSLRKIASGTGRKPRGWLGPALTETAIDAYRAAVPTG